MTIRPAIPADAPAIAHLHVATWQATYQGIVAAGYLASLDETEFTSRWNERLRGDASMPICVAEEQGALLGFAAGGPIRKQVPGYDAELYALYVSPAAQRCGAGRKLVGHIAHRLRSEGRANMLAWVLRDNPATAFYQHLGASLVTEDTVDIGGAHLAELAFGWSLDHLSPAHNEESERSSA